MTDEEMRRMASDITELKVMVARLDERVKTAIKNDDLQREEVKTLWERVYPHTAWGGVVLLFLDQYVRKGQ